MTDSEFNRVKKELKDQLERKEITFDQYVLKKRNLRMKKYLERTNKDGFFYNENRR